MKKSTAHQLAIEIIRNIGRACGLTRTEIYEVQGLIAHGNLELIHHSKEADRTPERIAFLGLVQYRKEKAIWYKPWIEWRLMNIQRRYTGWWEQIDSEIAIARPLESIIASAH